MSIWSKSLNAVPKWFNEKEQNMNFKQEEEDYKELIRKESMPKFKVGDRVVDSGGDSGCIVKLFGDGCADIWYDNISYGKDGLCTDMPLEGHTVEEVDEKEENKCRDGAILALFSNKELVDEIERRLHASTIK